MKASAEMGFLIICILSLSLLTFPIPKVWAYDWSIERPNQDVEFDNERVEGANTDGKACFPLENSTTTPATSTRSDSSQLTPKIIGMNALYTSPGTTTLDE